MTRSLITLLYDPLPEDDLRVSACSGSYRVTDDRGREQNIALSGVRQANAACLSNGVLSFHSGQIITAQQYRAAPHRYQEALKQTLARDPQWQTPLEVMCRLLEQSPTVHMRREPEEF